MLTIFCITKTFGPVGLIFVAWGSQGYTIKVK